MKFKAKLPDEMITFLEQSASIVDEKYFFLPFWFEKLEDGMFEMHHLDKLPPDLKLVVNGKRGLDAKIERNDNPIYVGKSDPFLYDEIGQFPGHKNSEPPTETDSK